VSTDEQNPLIAKFAEHLQYVDAVALVVLKCHLLIEEALDRIIGKFVFHPEFLEDARLSFAQKIEIARSMSTGDHRNPMWELVTAFNALRNDLSHSLTSAKRDQKTRRVIDVYWKLLDDETEAGLQKEMPDEAVLMAAAGFFLGFLGACEAEVNRFRSWVDDFDRVVNPHRHKAKDIGDAR
jgi:hypothetical protein